mmetsp:Transcript_19724/g.58211  ORF Transcript_19724/g.58211 Transcript_19724/m.58211 type:complete len:269 (+) Transcript_19724:233-1039(+)
MCPMRRPDADHMRLGLDGHGRCWAAGSCVMRLVSYTGLVHVACPRRSRRPGALVGVAAAPRSRLRGEQRRPAVTRARVQRARESDEVRVERVDAAREGDCARDGEGLLPVLLREEAHGDGAAREAREGVGNGHLHEAERRAGLGGRGGEVLEARDEAQHVAVRARGRHLGCEGRVVRAHRLRKGVARGEVGHAAGDEAFDDDVRHLHLVAEVAREAEQLLGGVQAAQVVQGLLLEEAHLQSLAHRLREGHGRVGAARGGANSVEHIAD